jgi:hypothetical protein
MDQAVSWAGLLELIKPYYSKTGRGRNPYPLETLRCIYPLQKRFSLSAPAMKGGAVRDHVSTSGITLNATSPDHNHELSTFA